ncbi:MAG: hypothetical protein IPG26_02855 [Coprothermobacter sp.]|nr:hypothetical protein [Coprothermobacter sp.]
MQSGRTLVPVRFISEQMGAKVTGWGKALSVKTSSHSTRCLNNLQQLMYQLR